MFYGVIFLQVISIVILFCELLYVFSKWTSKRHSFLLMMILAALVNNVGYLVEILSDTMEKSLFGTKLSYIGKAYIPLILLLFTLDFCRIAIPRWLSYVLVVLHTGVWILVLTCDYHTLYYNSISYVEDGMFPHLVFGHGIFYYVFLGSMVICFLTCVICCVWYYLRSQRKITRKQIACFLAMFFVTILGLLLFLLGLTGGYDTTDISYCLCAIILMISMRRYDLLGTVDMAKEYVVDNFTDGLIVVDEDGTYLYSNPAAKSIFDQLDDCEKADILKKLSEHYEKNENLFVGKQVYEVEYQTINMGDKPRGGMYLLHDITDGYYYTEHLEEAVRIQTQKAEERREKVEQMSLQMVETLAQVIDAKDKYTKGHSTRVAEYTVLLAKEMGYREEELGDLRYAALLHDIGKIGVPDSILNKPSKLTNAEYEVIKTHSVIGGDILNNVDNIPDAEDVARYHHERYDGKGYPEQRKGAEIPEKARLVCVADAYDAMNSKRIYRKALTKEKIRTELANGRGTQFDPEALDAFLHLFDQNKLEFVQEERRTGSPVGESGVIMKKILETMTRTDTKERDFLTGLSLRIKGEREIVEVMRKATGCLFYLDVDNLKKINDTMGHLSGDHLLQKVGGLLQKREDQGVACRFGGDQFLFFARNVNRSEAATIIEEILDEFENLKGGDKSLEQSSLSIGMCLTQPSDEYSEVFKKADKALYFMKQNGKAGYHFYDERRVNWQKEMDVDMKHLMEGLQSSGQYQGALDVEYPVFAKLYEYTKNLGERFEQSVKLVMITLEPVKDVSIDEMELAMSSMERAIQTTIRKVDICTRYSSVQFLVILMNVGDNTAMVLNRIFQGFYKIYPGRAVDLSYTVAELPDTLEEIGQEKENGDLQEE